MLRYHLVALFLKLAIAVSCALPAIIVNAQEDHADKQRQLNQLNREMTELRKLIAEFKNQRSSLQTSLQHSEVEIGQIQQKIRTIQIQLQREQTELKELQGQRKILNVAKREQQKLIEQQILAAYQMGQQKKLKILLNQEQPDKITRALTYYDYFNKARSEQIEAYTDIISDLNEVEPKITEKAASLAMAKADLDDQHRSLLSSKKQREKNLANINSAIKNKDQELKKNAQDRARLERLLEAVEQTIANISIPSDYKSFTSQKGLLPWPIQGRPNNRFGYRRSNSSLRWQGLNIPAREGSDVKAIHHGRVMFADWLRGSGLLLIIDHGDGYMSLYAHNQSLLKETGEWVSAGEPISTVGNSGGQANASLYFEIRHNGKPTDPRQWCKKV